VTPRRLLILALVVATLSASCEGSPQPADRATSSAPISPTIAPATSTPVAPPPPPASPPPTRGGTTSTCVNGWVTPLGASAQFTDPLGIIRRTTGVQGPLVVTDMRYFTGPESPVSEQGYLLVVERWYVRLYAKDDPAFQGRFLVETRRFGRGLSAVAPYDTHGFRSPDWIGFQYDSADVTPKTYPGLPGQWEGIPYDFVKGGAGLDFPGLPPQVVGCLDGT